MLTNLSAILGGNIQVQVCIRYVFTIGMLQIDCVPFSWNYHMCLLLADEESMYVFNTVSRGVTY